MTKKPATTAPTERKNVTGKDVTEARQVLLSLLQKRIVGTVPKKEKPKGKTSARKKKQTSRDLILERLSEPLPPDQTVTATKPVMGKRHVKAALAEHWLRSAKKNRRLDGRDVNRYANIMKRGDWIPHHAEGLVFDTTGRLIDGQHRLAAVIRAAETEGEDFAIPFILLMGFDPESQKVTNTGKTRTMAQTSAIVGQDATAFQISICKALWLSPEQDKAKVPRVMDYQKVRNTIEQYRGGIELASKKFGGQGSVTLAAIRSVIARAYYHCAVEGKDSEGNDILIFDDEEVAKLQRFVEVMDTGLSKGEHEFAPALVRDAYMNRKVRGDRGTLEMYRKTIFAVDVYMSGTPVKRLKQSYKQLFPLPDFAEEQE